MIIDKGPLSIYANTFEQWETSVHLKDVSHRIFLESSGEFGERQGVKLDITSGSGIRPPDAFDLETACARLEYLHGEEQALFFRLLKDEFLDAMNPEYGPSVQPQND